VGPASRDSPVSLLGDSRVSRRRPGPTGQTAEACRSAAPTKARARALFAAGVLAREQGDYASADKLINESQDIARQLGDKKGVAVSLNALAVFARDRGDVARPHVLFEASLGLWRELGDQKALARALSNLANVVKLQGDYERARPAPGVSFDLPGTRRSDRGRLVAELPRGCRSRSGRYRRRADIVRTGPGNFRELGDRWGIAGTLADLGSLAREEGNYSSARSLYGESIKLFQELDHKRGIARLLECFACLAAAQLDAERSLRLAGAAAALRQNIGAPLTPAEQAKLEASLQPAREALTDTVGTRGVVRRLGVAGRESY
jgi:tetratricopeptide (TPR) repeat protein